MTDKKKKSKKGLIDDAVDSVSSAVGDVYEHVKNGTKDALEHAKNATEDAYDSAKSTTQDAVDDVKDFLNGSESTSSSGSGSLGDTVTVDPQQLNDESVALAAEKAEERSTSFMEYGAVGGAFVGVIAVAFAFAVRRVRNRTSGGSMLNEDESAAAMAAETSADEDASEDEYGDWRSCEGRRRRQGERTRGRGGRQVRGSRINPRTADRAIAYSALRKMYFSTFDDKLHCLLCL